MPNMRIIYSNAIDSASNLTSTPACASTTPISNIQLAQRGKVARVVGVTSWSISGQIAGPVMAMALVGHNLTGGATVRLRFYSDFAMTVTIYDSTTVVGTPQVWGNPASSPNGGLQWGVSPWMGTGLLPGTPEYLMMWFSVINNAAAFQIDIVDLGNADGFLQVGRVYLGSYWSPLVNDAYGQSMAWKEASKQTRTDGGSLRTEGYLPYRVFKATFDAMAESDRGIFASLTRMLGLRLDFLVSFYPTAGGSLERDYTAAVKFTTLPDLTSPFCGYFASTAALEEI